MELQDTNHDSLNVYYDFVEDGGFDTSELRDRLNDSRKYLWNYEYPALDDVGHGMITFDDVGDLFNRFVGSSIDDNSSNVGSCAHGNADGVGNSSYYSNRVGAML